MKFSIILLVAILYLFSSVEAGISTTSPFSGITWNGGEPEQITWVDDGTAPKLEEITGPVTVELMAGGPQKQALAANIGTTFATAKQIGYIVPKDVGPPGNFYFIKFTSGQYTSFSGTFSIQKVTGTIAGFDPNDPNGNSTTASPASTLAAAPTQSSGPSSGSGAGYPAAAPQGTNTPTASTPDSASNTSAGRTSLPSELSSAVNNLVPSFASVATAVIALTFTYLY